MVTSIVRRCLQDARWQSIRCESYRTTPALRFPWKPPKSSGSADDEAGHVVSQTLCAVAVPRGKGATTCAGQVMLASDSLIRIVRNWELCGFRVLILFV